MLPGRRRDGTICDNCRQAADLRLVSRPFCCCWDDGHLWRIGREQQLLWPIQDSRSRPLSHELNRALLAADQKSALLGYFMGCCERNGNLFSGLSIVWMLRNVLVFLCVFSFFMFLWSFFVRVATAQESTSERRVITWRDTLRPSLVLNASCAHDGRGTSWHQ